MSRRSFSIAILLSFLLHIAVLVGLSGLKPSPPSLPREVEITLLEAPSQPQPKDKVELKQIVDQQEKSINDEIPDDAKYLSRNNQHVIKETKATQHGKFVNSDNGGPGQTAQQTTKAQPQSQPKALAKGRGTLPSLKDLKPALDWSPQALAQQPGTGPSQTDDHLKDAQDGPQTLLNTREFIYYSYYSRIKERLSQYWGPKIKDKVQRLLAQGRSIASDQDRITKMIITLDNKGTLIKVQVIGQSGIQDLDDAAVEAFRAAAPFPNPPAGIIEADGTIKIRWDFVLEAQSGFFESKFYADNK